MRTFRQAGEAALILDAEAIAALDVARELARGGVTCYAIGSEPNLLTRSRAVGRRRTLALPVDLGADGVLAGIIDFARRSGVRAILPLGAGSTWLVSTRRAALLKALPDVRFLVPEQGLLARVVDKACLYDLAARHGLLIPRTWLPADAADARRLAAGIGYPAIVKPRVTSGARGMTVVSGPAELAEAYSEVARVFPAPLIQEAIPVSSKLQVGVLRESRLGVLAVSCLEVLRQYPLSGGPSTCVRTRWEEDAVALALSFLEGLGWEGLAHLEFLRDSRDGSLRLVDFNPRVWGTLGASLAGEVNFPRILYAVLTGADPGPAPAQVEGRIWRRLFFADAMVYLRYLQRRLERWPGPPFWRLWGFREGLWDIRDPWPFLVNLLRRLVIGWFSSDALDYFSGRWGLRDSAHPSSLGVHLERIMEKELSRTSSGIVAGLIGMAGEAGPC